MKISSHHPFFRLFGRKASFLLFSIFLFFTSSCAYSVIVFETQAVPEPDMANNALGFYANKQVQEIDTIARLKFEAKQLMITPTCDAPGLYSVEYKITFWDLLRNTFTFGKRQRAHIKYVCIKAES